MKNELIENLLQSILEEQEETNKLLRALAKIIYVTKDSNESNRRVLSKS